MLGAAVARSITRSHAWLAVPLVALGCLSVFVHAAGRMPYPPPYQSVLIETAQGRTGGLPAPFCWRVGVPWLVRALPIDTAQAFWLVTLAGLALGCAALMWMLDGLGLPRRSVAGGGMAFVFLGPATGVNLHDYFLVDPIALGLLALACAAAVRRRPALAAAATVAPAFVKEPAVLAAAFALGLAIERRDRVAARWAGAALVMAVTVLALLRLLVEPSAPYSFMSEMGRVWPAMTAVEWTVKILGATTLAWSVWLPVAVLQLWHPPCLWRSLPFATLFTLATAQILAATHTERVVVYAFPAVLAACALEIEYLFRARPTPIPLVWGGLLACSSFWLVRYAQLVSLPGTAWASLALLIAAGAMMIVGHRMRRSTPG